MLWDHLSNDPPPNGTVIGYFGLTNSTAPTLRVTHPLEAMLNVAEVQPAIKMLTGQPGFVVPAHTLFKATASSLYLTRALKKMAKQPLNTRLLQPGEALPRKALIDGKPDQRRVLYEKSKAKAVSAVSKHVRDRLVQAWPRSGFMSSEQARRAVGKGTTNEQLVALLQSMASKVPCGPDAGKWELRA